MDCIVFDNGIALVEQKYGGVLTKMKERYYVLIKHMISKSQKYKSFMHQWINDMTATLLHNEKMAELNGTQSKNSKDISEMYKLERRFGTDDKYELTVRSEDKKSWNQIVPLENSFETALYSHLISKHGPSQVMSDWLETNGVAIAFICLPVIRQVCREILNRKNSSKHIDKTLLSLLKDSTYFSLRLGLRSSLKESNFVPLESVADLSDTNTPVSNGKLLITIEQLQEPSVTRKRKTVSQPTRKSTSPSAKSRKTNQPSVAVQTSINKENYKPRTVPAAMATIIDMSQNPDKMYHFLLVYEDYKTGHIQLRPMTNADISLELTIELFKIFCDFKPPKCIVVHKDFKDLFETALDALKGCFDFAILIETREHEMLDNIMALVDVKLKKWYLSFKSFAWSMGCHAVQWQINNRIATDGSTAHRRFFGINRKNNDEPQNDDTNKSDAGVTSDDDDDNIDADYDDEALNYAALTLTRLKPNSTSGHNIVDNISERNETEENHVNSNSCAETIHLIIDSDDEKPVSVKSEHDEDSTDAGTIHIKEIFSLKSEQPDAMDVVNDIEEALDNLGSISIKTEEDKDILNSIENELASTYKKLSERLVFETIGDEAVKSENEDEDELKDQDSTIILSNVDSPSKEEDQETLSKAQNLPKIITHNNFGVTQPNVNMPEINGGVLASSEEIKNEIIITETDVVTLTLNCNVCKHPVKEPVSCGLCSARIHKYCGGFKINVGFSCFRCLV